MNCNSCTKINPLPSCLSGYGTMELSNITFPGNSGEDLYLSVTDTATGHITFIAIVADDPIDISDLYPLMQHYYKLEFTKDGVPIDFLIENPDGTFVEGCCIEFIPSEGLNWVGAEYVVSTTQCAV